MKKNDCSGSACACHSKISSSLKNGTVIFTFEGFLLHVSPSIFQAACCPDLINHPTFEADFGKLSKGLPDHECIVSKIYAKNCKPKDSLKVLQACSHLTIAI